VPIRAVVLDLFDTLVDLRGENLPVEEHHGMPLPASTRRLHALLRERADVDFDTFVRALGEGARAFAESHFAVHREVPTRLRFEDLSRRLGLADARLPDLLTEIHMSVLRGEVVVPPHHGEVLDVLRQGLRIGLCSNFSHSETALGILEESDLRRRLDAIAISDAVGLRKPRREIFEAVLAELGVEPRETLHVGDSLRADVGGAAELGIGSVWITRRVRDPAERLRAHEGPPPDHVIGDLAELPGLVERLA
jgi:FMN phosphatase YigB (HAD superfamily)